MTRPTYVTGDAEAYTAADPRVFRVREPVQWSAVWAGLLVALGAFLLLNTLLVAIGASAVRVGTGATDEAAAAGGIVSAIVGLVCFLIGGFIAGRTAAVAAPGAGALHGFLVWALALLLILALAAFGLGQLFGDAGDLFSRYRAALDPAAVDAGDVREGIRRGALGAFLGLALPAIASTLGGWLGSRGTLALDRTTGRRPDDVESETRGASQ